MPKVQSHKVSLVGVDGQEQAVIFDIETEGVHLLSQKAQHLERFPFEVIVKWLPSTLRTQNPGTADCFDIQLKTPKGPRELRVKADSEKQAKKILKQLEATVQDLVDKRKALAAKQQEAGKGINADSNVNSAQPGKGPQSATLQHAAPSDMFSIQPSMLVSEADSAHRRPTGLTMVKGTKSPLGKAPSTSDKDSTLIPSASLRQSQDLPFNSNITFRQSSMSSASGVSGMDIAAVSPRQRRDPSPAELALARQASGKPSASAVSDVDTSSISMFTMSPRQRRDPSPAELAIAKQSSLGTSHDAGSQQDHAASALSPRQGRGPLAAEVAAARHTPIGSGAAATDGVSLWLNRDALPAETGVMKQSSMNSGISASGLPNATVSAISPRQRRDPSPAELALIRHQSSGIKDGGAAFGMSAEADAAAGNRQRRDSSPAQLAFTNQLPVTTEGGTLGQDVDDDIPRLKSFSGASTETELTSKAAKQKKKKRDPSPLSRMGSSLLRPFTKGLSKLRTSRSSEKDGKLQAQSRTASQSDSLASRATSASTLDSAGPSRFSSISLQPQIQTSQGAKAAAGRSESFRFNSPATDAPPDLAAEPSFAQDLPHNSCTSHQSSVLLAKPTAVAAPVALDTALSQTRTKPTDRHGAAPGLSNPSFGQAGHSSDDDEFSYDFSQTESWPAAGQRSTALASAAAVSQPRSATTSSAKPEAAVSRDSKASSGTNTKVLLGAEAGRLSDQIAESGLEHSRGSFVEAGNFRPQLSRAERPQLAIATASVYSPLEVGLATSPTMRANANGEGIQGKANSLREAHVEPSSETQSSSPASTSAAAVVSGKERLGVVLQNSIGDAQGATHSQPLKDSSTQGSLSAAVMEAASAGDQGGQASSSGDNTAGQNTSGQMASSPFSGAAARAQGSDSLPAESLSSALSAGSSEFDISEASPYQSPHDRSMVAHAVRKEAASPARTDMAHSSERAEKYNVQGSGYSTSPILGPASSQVKPSGDGDHSNKAVLGSASSQARGATCPALAAVISQGAAYVSPSQQTHEGIAGIGQVSAQARLTSPRKGFSDKPILAVYSRRPSADEEATQEVTGTSRGQQQSSDDALQARVNMLEEVVRQLSHDLKLAEAQQKPCSSSSSHAKEDVLSMKGSPATQREMQALSARVAELGCENEQLQWQLQSAQSKLSQAEHTAQQLQCNQSDRSSTSPEQDTARSSHLQNQLEELGRHNSELESELVTAVQNLKQEEAKGVKQQQQTRDQADHMVWELQHKVDNLTQENQLLLKHHEQLETRFESLTKQLAKAQHAQHAAEAQSKASEAKTQTKTTALQEQIDNLLNSSAAHLEVRHRLENEVASLQRQLGHAESSLSQQQNRARNHQQAEAATSGQVAALQQQAESVVQENATLERQCRQQAADMKQLQSDVQARSAEVVSLSREAAELIERLEAAEAAADRYEAKYRAAKGELQQSQALDAQHTAELEQLRESLSSEQAAAQSSQQVVEELTTRLNMIQEELAMVTSRQQHLSVSESAAQQQVAALAEAYEKASTACAAAEGEKRRLGLLLQESEAQLLQAQQKEGQVYTCIRTAMDAAREAAAARDKLLDQQAESEAELKALRAKMTRQAAAITAAADAEERVTAAEAKCKAAHADSSSWQTQVAEMRADRERLLKDKASLHSQIAELREHYASLGFAPTTGSSHLGSLRASQEAESARSEALSRLQSAQQSHERAAREWELEKQQLQASANEQRKRMAQVESTAISHRAEAASLFRQAEASRQEVASISQELSASRQSQGQLEAEVRGHAIGVRAEADATVEAVRMQLAAATDKLKRSSEASARSLASKQAELTLAQRALAALQEASALHSSKSEQMRIRATDLQDELRSLHADHSRLVEQYEVAHSCNAGLHHDLKACKHSLKQVSAQARALLEREETLSQAKRDLNVQLDRAELELPAQLEGKLQAHGGHRTKRSRADRIQAHLPGHELL
ncbi:hypothetical protein WJX77_008395 [Trebouxia sp. C0004]